MNNIYFALRFPDTSARGLMRRAIEHFRTSDYYGALYSARRMYDSLRTEAESVIYRDNFEDDVLSYERLYDFFDQDPGPIMGFEIRIQACKRYRNEWGITLESPELDNGYAEFAAYDPDFNYSFLRDCDANAVYDVGHDNNFFIGPDERITIKNITHTIHELQMLVELGATAIRGIGNDTWPERPETACMCYFLDPDNYRPQLQALHPEARLRPVTEQDVIDAADSAEDVHTADGYGSPIVYHNTIADGYVTEFYDALFERVRL